MRLILKILMTFLFFTFDVVYGQEPENDIHVRPITNPDSTVLQTVRSGRIESFSLTTGIANGRYKGTDSILNIKGSKNIVAIPAPNGIGEPGTAVIPFWRGGAFIGTGEMSVMPGLMRIDSGSFGFGQSFGNFSFYVGGLANKYGWMNGLHTQYGVNGNVQYSFSQNLSVTGYGTYYYGQPNGMPFTPAMIGYYRVSTFGGTVNYQFNKTFGLMVGGQAVQQFGTNRYQFEPIVTPTVKVGKVRFGLPVGQMLNGIIRSRIEENRRR